jgi:hypothetical protein
LPVLHVTVQPFDPEGALEASLPLIVLVFGTAHMPPPFNST